MHYNKDMLYISQMQKGEKLYHYTTMDALINIVSKREFWVTKWDYLNDIDEFKVAKDICVEVMKSEGIKPNIIEEVVNCIKKELLSDSISQDFYILSFSCDSDNQLLWSNYSNMDGVNIEIDFSKFVENLNYTLVWNGLVNYDVKSQISCMRNTIQEEFVGQESFGKIRNIFDLNNLVGEQHSLFVSHLSMICQLYSMFFKRSCFAGEDEYRFVFSGGENVETNFRYKKGAIIPYIKRSIESKDFIKGITIGPTNRSDIVKKGIRELFYYYQKSEDIKISNSQIPLRY